MTRFGLPKKYPLHWRTHSLYFYSSDVVCFTSLSYSINWFKNPGLGFISLFFFSVTNDSSRLKFLKINDKFYFSFWIKIYLYLMRKATVTVAERLEPTKQLTSSFPLSCQGQLGWVSARTWTLTLPWGLSVSSARCRPGHQVCSARDCPAQVRLRPADWGCSPWLDLVLL